MSFDLESRLMDRAKVEGWSQERVDEFREMFQKVFDYAERIHWWEEKDLTEDEEESIPIVIKGSKEE